MNFNLSRQLRKNQTPWEAKLWLVLRNRKVGNLKFRRQHKIGKYIVDFCCIDKKLVIELDGGHHNEEPYILQDQIRQKYIEDQGYYVLRIWNNEIDKNLDGVVDEILDICKLK